VAQCICAKSNRLRQASASNGEAAAPHLIGSPRRQGGRHPSAAGWLVDARPPGQPPEAFLLLLAEYRSTVRSAATAKGGMLWRIQLSRGTHPSDRSMHFLPQTRFPSAGGRQADLFPRRNSQRSFDSEVQSFAPRTRILRISWAEMKTVPAPLKIKSSSTFSMCSWTTTRHKSRVVEVARPMRGFVW
jgi:hypothetical protein